MISPDINFVQLCLQGDALIDDLDDIIEEWHESNDPRSLREVIGFTAEEYQRWLKDPDELKNVLFERRTGYSLPQKQTGYALAARSKTTPAESFDEILACLKK